LFLFLGGERRVYNSVRVSPCQFFQSLLSHNFEEILRCGLCWKAPIDSVTFGRFPIGEILFDEGVHVLLIPPIFVDGTVRADALKLAG
jgi:hypothetical protein